MWLGENRSSQDLYNQIPVGVRRIGLEARFTVGISLQMLRIGNSLLLVTRDGLRFCSGCPCNVDSEPKAPGLLSDEIRRPRQGRTRCLEHFHFMCFPRPPAASPVYIARRTELRDSLDGRLYLAGVFSGFLVV